MATQLTQPSNAQFPILNIAGYRFVQLDTAKLGDMKQSLLATAQRYEIKGTILLANEGINLYIAGYSLQLQAFVNFLEQQFPALADIHYKSSWSEHKPYTRMLVRIKRETISFDVPGVHPQHHTVPHLAPQKLKQWYDQGKDMLVLDTRNDYEVKLGTFAGAKDFNIRTFKQFIAKVATLDPAYKKKPVVTFCTGGIRCEKAAEYMHQQGFEEVYQLDGGILHYFEQCGGAHYEGDCFVFDKRVALAPSMQATDAQVCYSCRMPLQPGEFDEAQVKCPLCAKSRFGKADFARNHQEESIKAAYKHASASTEL